MRENQRGSRNRKYKEKPDQRGQAGEKALHGKPPVKGGAPFGQSTAKGLNTGPAEIRTVPGRQAFGDRAFFSGHDRPMRTRVRGLDAVRDKGFSAGADANRAKGPAGRRPMPQPRRSVAGNSVADQPAVRSEKQPRKPGVPRPMKPPAPVPREQDPAEKFEPFQLEGRNAILEALKADRPIDTLLIKKGENEGTLKVIIAMAKEKNIVLKEMTKEKLDELSQTGKHQGVIAYCAAHPYATITDILNKAAEKGEQPFVILLDGITDPYNLGAIIRTAEASGAHGVVIPKRRAASLTAVVGKTSAGALQYIPVARVANITAAMAELKKNGLWIACADMAGEPLFKAALTGALALVIGGEGGGVSRLVKEKCDFTVSVPMRGEIESLNASVAAGVLMYEVLRRRSVE